MGKATSCLKLEDRLWVVQQNIRIKNVNLSHRFPEVGEVLTAGRLPRDHFHFRIF